MSRKTDAALALWMVALGLFGYAGAASAHDARPAYLEITETAPGRYNVLWRTPLLSGMRLPVALKLPHAARTLGAPAVRELSDSLLEQRLIELPGDGLPGRRIDFVGLQATITDVLVRVQMADGRRSTTLVSPSRPWVEVAASPGPRAVAGAYVLHGIRHIACGMDHLLFVLGLVLIVRDRWMLLETVTAFTIGHSITLAIATLGFVSAPVDPLNTAIALSILFLGAEIVRSWRGETSLTIKHPWVVAFLFGLVHGFALAGALTNTGLPRPELPLALVSFNVGVESTQVAFVALIVALAHSFRHLQIRWPGWVTALPGYAVGTLGAFWTIQRTVILLGMR